MRVVALLSGGKDSIYATHYASSQGYEVICFLSMVSKNPESYMYHTLKIDKVDDIAKSMGIRLVKVKTEGVKEEELEDLKKALKKIKKEENIEGVISGALASDYQKTRIEKICYELDLAPISPLWHVDPKTYMEFVIDAGYDVRIVGCFAEGLDDSWIGKKIDSEMIKRLEKLNEKVGLHIGFEGGEAETLVVNGPGFDEVISL